MGKGGEGVTVLKFIHPLLLKKKKSCCNQRILKVARAPSRELVALLEGTDEALDGLEGLGEVVIDTIACS